MGMVFLRNYRNTSRSKGICVCRLPFSPPYGPQKFFFRIFLRMGGNYPPAYADGISFFMFGGAIGPDDGVGHLDTTEFQIGGIRWLLGYSP